MRIEDADRLPYTDVDRHHHMSESKNFPLDLYQFVHSPPNDPAKKVGSLRISVINNFNAVSEGLHSET